MCKVTKVYVRNVNGENGLVGFANVIVDDCLALNDIAIVKRDDKFFINEPIASKYTNAEGKDVYSKYYNPITAEFRKELNDSIIEAFCK
jgi:DNA-binding cell septation regulator SpoVG